MPLHRQLRGPGPLPMAAQLSLQCCWCDLMRRAGAGCGLCLALPPLLAPLQPWSAAAQAGALERLLSADRQDEGPQGDLLWLLLLLMLLRMENSLHYWWLLNDLAALDRRSRLHEAACPGARTPPRRNPAPEAACRRPQDAGRAAC